MELAIQNVAEEYKPIYRTHYKTIQTRVTKGRLRDVYHFLIVKNYSKTVAKKLLSSTDLKFDASVRYKINASFGFILRNIDSDELSFFYPSQNCLIYDTPKVVANETDFNALLEDLEREDATAYAMANRPSTKWRVAQIVCIRLDVYKTG